MHAYTCVRVRVYRVSHRILPIIPLNIRKWINNERKMMINVEADSRKILSKSVDL